MIKQDLVQRVVERTGLPRTKAEAAVDAIFESMKQTLVELQNRQNEAWVNKNKEAYDRALRGGPPIRVVIANPPSAQPLTGGTMPVDSR